MKQSSTAATLCGGLSLVLGLSLLGAAGCGAPEADEVQSVESAITGDWTPLSFINGWEAYGGTTPGIGVVNGVVTFRGAIKAPVGSANSAAFLFPSALLPDPAAGVYMRTVVSGNLGAAVFINPFVAQTPVSILQDGVGLTGLGAAARTFTSLDGLSFDRVGGDPIVHDDAVWDAVYRFREHEHGCNTCGAYVKDVDGFVRLQGLLTKHVQSNYDGYLFTLPAKYVPGQMVMVPANFGGGTASTQSWGAIKFDPDGKVYAVGNPIAANKGTSFEGVWFSRTLKNTVALPLSNGWQAYSAREVKVSKPGDVVRLQGAIKGGTSATLGTLPAGYRPAKTVKLVAAAYGAVPATIVINTSGVMTVEGQPDSITKLYLSLDGVSFGL